MKPKKITFYGLFGQENIGNDCTFHAIYETVINRFPDAQVQCICTGPDIISRRYNISAFPIKSVTKNTENTQPNKIKKLFLKLFIRIPNEIMHWAKAYMLLRSTDMLIVPGTGLLVDYSTTPFGYPYSVFAWTTIARISGCKVLFVSVGAGPIFHPLSKWFIKKALSTADYRSYRDLQSKEYIENIGFKKTDDPIYPDLAFSLTVNRYNASEIKRGHYHDVGVGVMDYYGIGAIRKERQPDDIYNEYIGKMCSFCEWLTTNQYTLKLIIGDVKFDQKAKKDLIELIKKQIPDYDQHKIYHDEIQDLEQLLEQLKSIDVIVSPRFHNIILALILNKPVISISYNEKFDYLMKDFGLDEYCQPIQDLDYEHLVYQLKKLEINKDLIKTRIKEKVEEYRKALDDQYHFIFDKISDYLDN